MFNNLQTHKFATITSYEQAESYFNRTKVIRGKDKAQDGVPLRHDRKYHQGYRLVKENDAYKARMYRTDVIVFLPDGSIYLDASYGSIGTCEFANHFLPRGFSVSIYTSKPIIYDYQTKTQHAISSATRVRLMKSETNPHTHAIDLTTVATMHVRKVNLKKGAAARKLVRPLLDYCKTMFRLGRITVEAHTALRGGPSTPMPRFHTLNPPDLAYLLDEANFPYIASTFYRSYYYYEGHRTDQPICVLDYARAKEEITDQAYKLTGAYYEEPLPLGKLHRDMRYTKTETV